MGYGQMLVLLLGLLLLGHSIRRRGPPPRALLIQVALSVLCFLLLMAPVLLTFAAQSAAVPASSVQGVSLPLLLDHPEQLSLAEQVIVQGGARLEQLLGGGADAQRRGLLLPASLLVLALLSSVFDRGARTWALVAALFVLLSLGPYHLSLGPHGGAGYPLPAWLLYNFVPTFARMRKPARLLMPALVALVILAAFALKLLSRLGSRPGLAHGASAVALFAVLLEVGARGGVELPLRPLAPPEPTAYHLDRAAQPRCAMLGVPLAVGKPTQREEAMLPVPHWPALEMYYQSVHGQPLLAGLWVNFSPPAGYLAFLQDNPVLADIQRIQRGEAPAGDDGSGLAALREAGFCEVKLTLPWLQPWAREPMRRYLRDLLGPPQSWRDAGVEAYPLTR
jgi:hypothetical protein